MIDDTAVGIYERAVATNVEGQYPARHNLLRAVGSLANEFPGLGNQRRAVFAGAFRATNGLVSINEIAPDHQAADIHLLLLGALCVNQWLTRESQSEEIKKLKNGEEKAKGHADDSPQKLPDADSFVRRTVGPADEIQRAIGGDLRAEQIEVLILRQARHRAAIE